MRWGIFQRHFLPGDYDGLTSKQYCLIRCSLRSKRLEVVGARMRAREGDKRGERELVCLPLARPFLSCVHNFQAPVTQATSDKTVLFTGQFIIIKR